MIEVSPSLCWWLILSVIPIELNDWQSEFPCEGIWPVWGTPLWTWRYVGFPWSHCCPPGRRKGRCCTDHTQRNQTTTENYAAGKLCSWTACLQTHSALTLGVSPFLSCSPSLDFRHSALIFSSLHLSGKLLFLPSGSSALSLGLGTLFHYQTWVRNILYSSLLVGSHSAHNIIHTT